MIAAMMQGLYKCLQAYPLGSKKNQAVLNAIRALSANFAKQEQGNLVPAAIQQLALSNKPGPMAGLRPQGMMPAAPPGGAPPPNLPGPGGPPGMEEAA